MKARCSLSRVIFWIISEVISEIAQAYGKSPAQVILRWNLQRSVTVIPGSGNPDHIQENTQFYNFELSDDEMTRMLQGIEVKNIQLP